MNNFLQFFLTRIVDDLSTAIRDQFRSLPDEFVTGPLSDSNLKLQLNPTLGNGENVNKGHVESLITCLGQIISTLENTSHFSHGKKDDFATVSKNLSSIGTTQGKIPILGTNWAGSKDLMTKITSEFAKIGIAWTEFGDEYDTLVLEPFKQLKEVLQGFKELIEKNSSEKSLNMDFKKNAEKIQNMRQNKCTGLVTTPEIRTRIEDRIGQFHVDDLFRRKNFVPIAQTEENQWVYMFMGEHFSPFEVHFSCSKIELFQIY